MTIPNPQPKPVKLTQVAANQYAGKEEPQPLVVVGGVPGLPYALPAALGTAGQVLAVNAAGTGLEWIDLPGA